MAERKGLPVPGLSTSERARRRSCSAHKAAEVRSLRLLDELSRRPGIDPRWSVIGRLRPPHIDPPLPEDGDDD